MVYEQQALGPTARNTDPYTSKAAQPNDVMILDDVALLVFWLTRMPPGSYTRMEIADWAITVNGVDWLRAYQVANKRTTEAVKLGLVIESEPRRCRKTGRTATPIKPRSKTQ